MTEIEGYHVKIQAISSLQARIWTRRTNISSQQRDMHERTIRSCIILSHVCQGSLRWQCRTYTLCHFSRQFAARFTTVVVTNQAHELHIESEHQRNKFGQVQQTHLSPYCLMHLHRFPRLLPGHFAW